MIWDTLTPKERITRAKIQLGYDKPFWAYLVMNANIKDGTNSDLLKDMKTIGVNNKGDIYYHDDFIKKLSEEQLKGILAHEVSHIAFKHLERLKDLSEKDARLWNISADIVVNSALLRDGFTLHEDGIIPNTYRDEFKNASLGIEVENVSKKSVEQIYHELQKNADKEQKDERGGHGGNDKHGYEEDENGDTENTTPRKDWKDVLASAVVYAKQRGKLTGDVAREVDSLLNPKVSWRSLLYKYITNNIPSDYTYQKPSRKSIASGFYLPSSKKEELEVVVGVDTSGSIGQKEYNEFISEMISISKSFANVKLKLIAWDTEVKNTYEFKNGEIEKIKDLDICGYGGTNVNCLFKEINDNHNNTKLVVVFTDGYFGTIEESTSYPIIWVLLEQNYQNNIDRGKIVELG